MVSMDDGADVNEVMGYWVTAGTLMLGWRYTPCIWTGGEKCGREGDCTSMGDIVKMVVLVRLVLTTNTTAGYIRQRIDAPGARNIR